MTGSWPPARTSLPWIKEYSPYELVSADDPPIFMHYSAAPALGKDRDRRVDEQVEALRRYILDRERQLSLTEGNRFPGFFNDPEPQGALLAEDAGRLQGAVVRRPPKRCYGRRSDSGM